MEIRDWTATRLWSELQRRNDVEGRAVTTLLASSMPDIQAVLAQGGTAETDFTLHDSGHAFRVAQRMIDVIPDKSLAALSCYEQALLLLSAYLHDIGMTPRMRVLAAIDRYLLTGDPQDLPQVELDCLQQWLDDFRGGIVPPIAVAETTVAVLETVEELVTYYARHRHNDWSEQWTREYFGEIKLGTYAGWLEDLVLLCRSHHYGYDELRADTFRPRFVGAGGAVVNLRYLAAVLRIADVLEFDPERTPAVVFNHRDVNAGSVIYWHKDHDISLIIDNGRVLVSARPTSARIHKAIEDTVAQIDDELAVCKRLAEELPFNVCPPLSQVTAHEWNLASTTHASIEPLRHAYEYINGAFRPNTSRILNLLSGIELYGSPFAAVRELLQNAMDAVREQIAYVRLRRDNPADEVHARELSRSHVISLRIEADDQGYWLICADSGVGMSKRIICDYLLVSGQSQRHDLCELERRCHRSGFSVGRTGQFGIGVLSYFMVARRVSRIPSNVALEVDWASGGAVSVDRQQLRLSAAGGDSLNYAAVQANEHLRAFAATTGASRYHLLTSRVVGGLTPTPDPYWISVAQQKGASWQKIRFPIVDPIANTYKDAWRPLLRCGGHDVSVVGRLSGSDDFSEYYDGIAWHGENVPPSRVVLYHCKLVPLWDRIEKVTSGRLLAPFPPTADAILGAEFSHYSARNEEQIVWNRNHRIVKEITDKAWEWCLSAFDELVDPLKYEEGILRSRARACAWLAHSAIKGGREDVWQGLIERSPSFLARVFSLAFGSNFRKASLLFWIEDRPDTFVRVLTATAWHVERDRNALAALVGSPDLEWLLTEANSVQQESPRAHSKRKRTTRTARKRARRDN